MSFGLDSGNVGLGRGGQNKMTGSYCFRRNHEHSDCFAVGLASTTRDVLLSGACIEIRRRQKITDMSKLTVALDPTDHYRRAQSLANASAKHSLITSGLVPHV